MTRFPLTSIPCPCFPCARSRGGRVFEETFASIVAAILFGLRTQCVQSAITIFQVVVWSSNAISPIPDQRDLDYVVYYMTWQVLSSRKLFKIIMRTTLLLIFFENCHEQVFYANTFLSTSATLLF